MELPQRWALFATYIYVYIYVANIYISSLLLLLVAYCTWLAESLLLLRAFFAFTRRKFGLMGQETSDENFG